ncbi:MAG: pilus assembly protein PilM [Candidatus Omnitrophota bacterium]
MIGGIKSFIKNLKIPRLPLDLKRIKLELNAGTVAIEIGNDWLKIAQIPRAKGSKVPCHIKLLKLAQIKDSVSSAIDDTFKDLKLNRKNVVSCIPRHLVTVRMLDVPATDPKEISDMINLQVGKQTPYSKEEIVSSHKIIEIGPSGYSKVMLAIAARNIINERADTLTKAGLDVKGVAISSEGVFNWFSAAYLPEIKLEDSQGIALIDIDSNYSDFIVIRRGKMAFTRNIFIGANHLMENSRAESAQPWGEKFVDELKRSLERYQTEEKSVKIVKMFLSGAGPNINGLDLLLASDMEIPTLNTDQLKNIRTQTGAQEIRDESFRFVSLTQLFGVSASGKEPQIDLTMGEQKVQNLMEAKRKQLTVMGVLIVSIVTMLSFLMLTDVYNKNAYLVKLKHTISKIGTEADDVEKMRAVISLVEKRLDSRGSSIEVINEIYDITPKEIYLTDINIDEKQSIVLKGGGLAMSDVFKYVKKLEESNMFESVKTTYTTTKKDKDAEFAEFEIACMYQK